MSDRGQTASGVTWTPTEGHFTIDSDQRVVEWDHGAVAMLGVPADQALGQPCYTVLKGLDAFGRPVCDPPCPAIKKLQQGHIVGGCYLRFRGMRGSYSRLLCELVALPATHGGALGRLRSADGGARSLSHDMAALTTLATSISSVSLPENFDRSLGHLRDITGADWAEVFLAEPDSLGMSLTWHHGRFRSAFFQKLRFKPFEDYPGIILASQRSIVTDGLAGDSRFLRSRVKEMGFNCYVGVPLRSSWGVAGSVGVAFRSQHADLSRVLNLLSYVSTPFGLSIEAYLMRLQDMFRASSYGVWDAAVEPSKALKDLLSQTVMTSGAQGGVLNLLDNRGTCLTQRFIEGMAPQSWCPTLKSDPSACPALTQRSGIALYGPRAAWPPPCCRSPRGAGTHYCIPLVADEKVTGLLQAYYSYQGGSPPSWSLVSLEYLGRNLGLAIQSGQNIIGRLFRAQLSGVEVLKSLENRGQPQQPSAWPPEQQHQQTDLLHLGIRCFGPFELYLKGVRVSLETLHRKKVLTLLKILLTVTNHRKRVSKESLIEHLWPENPLTVRTSQLYVLVHELRRLLEPHDTKGSWMFVRNEGDRYYFNQHASCLIDVQEFEAMVAVGQKAEAKGATKAAIASYEAAMDLYRGDYMEDEPFAEWCRWERERLCEVYLDMLRRLAALWEGSESWERSVEVLRTALRVDPLQEKVHRALMYALWASGRRDEAVRQYQVCRDLLLDELGVPPLPETEHLLESITTSPMP